MADGLAEALLGLNFSPAQDPYGLAQQAVATSTPSLISPYASTGKAIGIGLGSVLLQSLLGYQARQSALQDTLQANTLANQMLKMQTPEERTALIGQEGIPSAIGSRLSTLATALTAQEQARQNQINLASGLEVAKLKATGDFYNTPEGLAAREQELALIKAKAIAGRTPLEELLAREEAKKERELAVVKAKNEGADRRQKIALDAKSGEADKARVWQEEQAKINRDFEQELAKFKIEFGVEAAANKAKRLAEIENQLIDQGLDPDLRRAEARITATKEMQSELNIQKSDLLSKRQQEYNEGIIQRAKIRKQMDAEYPTVTAKVKDDAANAIAFGNLAKTLAADIRKISSYPEYRAIKAMSALGDEQLKSRTIDIADRLTRLRSGMATRGAEDERLEKIALGDLTVGPQEAASILERLANDTLNFAADKYATQTQNPSNLINMMRQAAQSNTEVSLQPRIYQGGGSEQGSAADIFVAQLKSKYGADWKVKMSADEKAAAAALVRAGRQ